MSCRAWLPHHIQVLPVPELIPFRLTRCLLGALAPVGAAVLEKPLEVALASLRANKELLEGVLDVFSAEPLQEWQREGEVLSKAWPPDKLLCTLVPAFAL